MLKEKTLQEKRLELQKELNNKIKKTLEKQGFTWSNDGQFNLSENQFIEIVDSFYNYNGSTHRIICNLNDSMGKFDLECSKFENGKDYYTKESLLKLIRKDGQIVGRLNFSNKKILFFTSVSRNDFWYDIMIHNTLITIKPL